MNPKKLIVPVLCVLLGCAGGAAMGTVTAQTWAEPAMLQRWQQECVRSPSNDDLNPMLRDRGEHGWRFVGLVGSWLCFERPAQ